MWGNSIHLLLGMKQFPSGYGRGVCAYHKAIATATQLMHAVTKTHEIIRGTTGKQRLMETRAIAPHHCGYSHHHGWWYRQRDEGRGGEGRG